MAKCPDVFLLWGCSSMGLNLATLLAPEGVTVNIVSGLDAYAKMSCERSQEAHVGIAHRCLQP